MNIELCASSLPRGVVQPAVTKIITPARRDAPLLPLLSLGGRVYCVVSPFGAENPLPRFHLVLRERAGLSACLESSLCLPFAVEVERHA
jgi:hypothetical protein